MVDMPYAFFDKNTKLSLLKIKEYINDEQRRCYGWWHPGRDYVVSPFFGPKIDEDQKKGLCRKTSGVLVKMRLATKQNEKARSAPQISGVMVVHHNMVSPQMMSPGAGRPLLATPLMTKPSSV